MEQVNEEWFDALLRHQVFSTRVAGSIRNEVNELLLATEGDIAARLREALRGDVAYTPKRLAKAQKALQKIKAMRNAGWDKADKLLYDRMIEYIQGEMNFLSATLETVVPVLLESNLPPAEKLQAIVKTHPFEGRTLREWAKTLRRSDIQRIDDQVKIGLVQGETGDQIARRLVGTYKLNGKDGVFQMTRNHAESTVRTAVNSYSNSARAMFLNENSDLFGEEIFVATLDNRTTPVCRSYDGHRFPLGEGPIPPLHFNCRSIRVASITGEALGSRPAKPFTQRQFTREFSRQEGLGNISSRDKLPYGWKTKFDSFASRRIREMTEVIPARINYQTWLSRQSAAFQDDVLGPTRGRLFRNGDVTLDRFVNRKGDEIPLYQLAAKDAEAFRSAGLDPGKFYR